MNAIIFSALMGIVMMFAGIFFKKSAIIKNIAIGLMIILLTANLLEAYGYYYIKVDVKQLLIFEKFGLFFNSIAFASTLIYVCLSGKAFEEAGVNVAEYFALIFFCLCGIAILSSFNNLLMLFIGIEIMSIPLYILTGSDKQNLKGNEASLKYFLMGAFSTGLMLMGIALIYGAIGSFSLQSELMGPVTSSGVVNTSFLVVVGLLLLFVSMAFKVSAAPFHFWTPDVYDGAPTIFTSFMATIVKAAGFIALIRVFGKNAAVLGYSWNILIAIIITCTLLIGNITAVFQQSVKRMLAYSSIAQAGFMLLSLYSRNDMAVEGLLLYSAAYSLATIGMFAVLMKMDDLTFDGFNGLASKQPLVAFSMTIFVFSLAGIPLTAGFFAKYYLLASVLKSGGPVWLVILAVIFAAVSIFYYFRLIQAMYFKTGNSGTKQISVGFKTSLIFLALLILAIGIMPSLLLQWFYF